MSTDRNSSFGRRLFLRMTTALCAAAGLPALGMGGALAAHSVGAVTKLRGQARASRQGSNVMLEEGDQTESGDNVVTGPDARLKIEFKDGSILTLGENY